MTGSVSEYVCDDFVCHGTREKCRAVWQVATNVAGGTGCPEMEAVSPSETLVYT